MFRRVVIATLALGLLTMACKGNENEPAPELAGDGSRAYFKLATTWCDRAAQCLDASGFGTPWASPEACAELEVFEFSVRGDNTCAPDQDFAADKDELAKCLGAMRAEPCPTALASTQLIVKARRGVLPQCRKLAEQLARAEDERAGAKALGETCGESNTFCTWDAYCDRKEEQRCGVCRALPGEGAACLFTEDGDAYCSAGLLCVGEVCTAELPKLGAACTEQGYCAAGLACDPKGVCRTGQTSSLGQIGASCGTDDDRCVGGRCVDGRCAPLAGLGEACPAECEDGCEDACQRPYVCLKGKCSDVPACNTGKLEEVCSGSDQCGPNLGCIYNSDGPSHCEPIPAELGQPCSKAEGCYEGLCLKGVCTLGEAGAACENYRDCRSRDCDYETGRCTEAQVCE